MAWRIAEQVERGAIDNRIKDTITGMLWLHGWAQPLRLQLTGNAGADFAGRLVRFTNPNPKWVEASQVQGLTPLQTGVCGDIQALRQTLKTEGDPDHLPPTPTRFARGFYLEWFSESNGRVVVETEHFELSLSEPAWLLSPEDVQAQAERNTSAWKHFMEDLTATITRAPSLEPATALPPPAETGEDEKQSEAIERLLRINELKHEAERLSGGQMAAEQSHRMPLKMEEMFWRNVVAFEKAPRVSRLELLQRDGVAIRPLAELDAESLLSELWKIIHALARRQMFLTHTDHLSNYELYRLLVEDVLPEIGNVPPEDAGWQCEIDLTDFTRDEEGDQTFLRYYADDVTREFWEEENPGLRLPPKQKPLYHRDHRLPRPDEGLRSETWTPQGIWSAPLTDSRDG